MTHHGAVAQAARLTNATVVTLAPLAQLWDATQRLSQTGASMLGLDNAQIA